MDEQVARQDERGASLVEYALLIAGVVAMAMASVTYLGAAVADEFAAVNSALAFDDVTTTTEAAPSQPNPCPSGWEQSAGGPTKKNGQSVDANGDGFVCVKDVSGNGNTGNGQNVKDNN